MPRCLAFASAVLALAVVAPLAQAAPVKAKVELSDLRAIQLNTMQENGDDAVLVLVNGVARGQDVQKRVPDQGTLPSNRKKPPITDKQPVTLWAGELGDKEFALLTVALFQGEGKDQAKLKAFQDQLAAAAKPARAKKTLSSADDAKAVAADTLKAEQALIKGIKDVFSRDKKTDHYGGLFNVLVWNNNGKLTKRLDPVGLTFGEHYGIDPKIYTKIKHTRTNVMELDPANGDWFETQYGPLNDDEDGVHVKMLETEYVKSGDDVNKKVTDYLATIKVYAADKALKWSTGGEHPGPGTLHIYWDFAE
jgi:hypothetical protein